MLTWFIVMGVLLLLLVMLIVYCERKQKKKEEEAKRKEEQEAQIRAKFDNLNKFKSWWLASKFNKFIVVDKRMPVWSNGNRYHTIKQEATGKYFDNEVGAADYYNHEKGDCVAFINYQSTYVDEETIEAYNKETGSTMQLADKAISDIETLTEYIKFLKRQMEEKNHA